MVDYVQFTTIMVALVSGMGFIFQELKSFRAEISQDVKIQAKRSDDLYRMFIDLVKETRK